MQRGYSHGWSGFGICSTSLSIARCSVQRIVPEAFQGFPSRTMCESNMDKRRISLQNLPKSQSLGRLRNVGVYKVDSKTGVKTSDVTRLSEAAAMNLARRLTSIPVPEVYNAYVDETSGHVVIIMEYIEGDVLRDVWDDMKPDQKEEVIQQLKAMMSELRAIKGNFVGSVDGTSCEDQLLSDELGGCGPYSSESEFHDGIIKALRSYSESLRVERVAAFIKALPKHDIVFTHSDLAPRNIIVKGTKVVGILDWEMAGFYPDYWEYVKALYRPDWESKWMQDEAIDRILDAYPLEHAVFLHAWDIFW